MSHSKCFWHHSGADIVGSDDGGFDYADMYLTLGLAALSSLWFAIFIWFFNIYRMVTSSPIAASTAISQGIKRFIYRATRAFLMVNVIMIPSLIIDVLVKGVKYRSAKGVTGFGIIGGGVACEQPYRHRGEADGSSVILCLSVHLLIDDD